MLKYFCVNDVIFKSIDVQQSNFQGLSLPSNIETTYLEDFVEAMTGSVASTLIPGADDAAKLNTVRGWFDESVSGLDDRQIAARQIVNDEAPLRLSQVTDPDGPTSGTVHELGYRYILPPDLWEGISATLTGNTNTNSSRVTAQNKLIIKSFCIRHDNIVKHSSPSAARAAYNTHTLKGLLDDNESTIDSAYLKPTPSGD